MAPPRCGSRTGRCSRRGCPRRQLPAGIPLTLGARAESVLVDGAGQVRGRAEVVERLGERTLAHVSLADGALVVAEAPRESELQVGETVALRFEPGALHLFDGDGKAYHARSGARAS